jgi:diacylglycerol kinase family enzyme
MTFKFRDPRLGSSLSTVNPAQRLTTLANKRIGLLWNNRAGGDRMLKQVAEVLNEKHHLGDVYFTKKTFHGNAAPAEIIDDLVGKVDAVIVGVGD